MGNEFEKSWMDSFGSVVMIGLDGARWMRQLKLNSVTDRNFELCQDKCYMTTKPAPNPTMHGKPSYLKVSRLVS